MKIQLNYDSRNGCGVCVSLCPDIFKFDKRGKITIHSDILSVVFEDDCKQASAICPIEAIELD